MDRMETIPEIQLAVRARVRDGFHREVLFSTELHPDGDFSIEAKTSRGEFQWRGTGTSALLAWSRLLTAVPSTPMIFCQQCDRR